MNLDPSALSSIVLIAIAFAGAFLAALWLSLIFWTYRDISKRTHDSLLRILAALIVALLNLPGILIYLILRPPHTLEEEYEHTLEEEALLQSIEDSAQCPGCNRHVAADWLICPNCQTHLKKTCRQCGKLMDLPWNICPFCGSAAPGMRLENTSMDDALRNLPGDAAETLKDG